MTPQEIIDTLEVARAEVEWEYPMNYAVAFDEAIEIIKSSRIPQKTSQTTMTNFEKLKADIQGMKANQFLRVCRGLTNYDCKYCIWGKESACKSGCIGGINKWLESEVEE